MLVNNNNTYAKNIQNQSPAGVTFEIFKPFYREKMIPEKSLGKGYENSVYKIDDKYVLRVPAT